MKTGIAGSPGNENSLSEAVLSAGAFLPLVERFWRLGVMDAQNYRAEKSVSNRPLQPRVTKWTPVEWGLSPADKCPRRECAPDLYPQPTPSPFSVSLPMAECVEGEFGGNPFPAQIGLWLFSKLTVNLLLWNLGCFGPCLLSFMNQHRIDLSEL